MNSTPCFCSVLDVEVLLNQHYWNVCCSAEIALMCHELLTCNYYVKGIVVDNVTNHAKMTMITHVGVSLRSKVRF